MTKKDEQDNKNRLIIMNEDMQKRFAIQGNKIDEIHKKVADETQKVIE